MLNPNSLRTNALVTLLVAVMVILLPWADRRICARLKLNLQGGLSENRHADRLLRLRRFLLLGVLLIYLVLFAWIVFFSRTSSGDYTVHVAPLEDLKNAFSTPTGFSGWFRTLFTEGFSSAFSQISIVRPQDLSQFYMNMMLFVPMGYLLPYVFRWFRARVWIRPVLFCLILSLLVENLQLITQRGMYDFDDIIANTLGGWIGQMLFIASGYVVTHPGWRKNLREFRKWKRSFRGRTLLPYMKKPGLFRTTLVGTDSGVIWDFYVYRLGFRPPRQIGHAGSGDTIFLFEMGKNQVEILCSAAARMPEIQYLTLSVSRLPAAMSRLKENGIDPGPLRQDPATCLRMAEFAGPDHVWIRLIETEG